MSKNSNFLAPKITFNGAELVACAVEHADCYLGLNGLITESKYNSIPLMVKGKQIIGEDDTSVPEELESIELCKPDEPF